MSPTASSLARSFFSHLHHHRDHQVHSMVGHDPPDPDSNLLLFDRHVSSLLGDHHQIPFLSLSWLHHLLSSFLLLLDDFPSLQLPNCPSLKSLDLLNAVRDGLDRVRHSRVHLDTALISLSNNQLHRASKALTLISPEPDHLLAVGPTATRHRSFSLRPHNHHHHEIPIRTLSWNVSVSRTWSASRQLSAAAVSLSKDAMGSVLLFVLWTLVAAVPCQDRGVHAPVSPPRGHAWAGAMAAVQERVLEEYRKKGNENVSGLMKEICEVENGARRLVGMLKAERTEERERIVKEMETARKGLEGLEGLDRLVREIFLRIVRSRSDGV